MTELIVPDKTSSVVHRTCDLCGHADRIWIPELPGSAVCNTCGFVYVPERRSAEEIARAWDDLWSEAYTSQWPGVIARLTYVAEFCDQTFGWENRQVLDIGAGEGTFMEMVSARKAFPEAIEPSAENSQKINQRFFAHHGTAESFNSKADYDVVTLLWTLENTGDCMAVLKQARKFLKPDGLIVVATGSRILVPFKKPLGSYVSDLPPDLHCYRWSASTLGRALNRSGFNGRRLYNDYEQNDWMVVIAGISGGSFGGDPVYESTRPDDSQQVLRYFKSWQAQFP